MVLQEKKYKVDSFKDILQLLKKKKAVEEKKIVATHYYGEHSSNNVEKFVEYEDRYEIHILEELNGKFTLTEHSKIVNRNAGITWLKKRGFTKASIVKMVYTEYIYGNGIVGLYKINDFLNSVILNYPSSEHSEKEKEFGLTKAEIIKIPYNKCLEKIGHFQSISL